VIKAQGEVEKVSRDMWKTTLSIGQEKNNETNEQSEEGKESALNVKA
jgi:hypothetical protein